MDPRGPLSDPGQTPGLGAVRRQIWRQTGASRRQISVPASTDFRRKSGAREPAARLRQVAPRSLPGRSQVARPAPQTAGPAPQTAGLAACRQAAARLPPGCRQAAARLPPGCRQAAARSLPGRSQVARPAPRPAQPAGFGLHLPGICWLGLAVGSPRPTYLGRQSAMASVASRMRRQKSRAAQRHQTSLALRSNQL